MDVSLSETQQLIKNAITDYLERDVAFDRIREVEVSGDYDRVLWAELVNQGWLGLPFAEDLGGQGGALTDLGVLLEALQRRAVLIPILETIASGLAIAKFADKATATEVVGGIIAGTRTISPAVLEKSDRFDDVNIRATGDTVTGDKYFVDYGQLTTHHLVAAKGDDGAVGLYLVDAKGSGVTCKKLANVGSVPQANVTYSGAVAKKVGGADGVQYLLRVCRGLAAIQCLACSQQALDMSVDYAGMRVQFGRPIGSFQAVQHHCANMATDTMAARFLVYEALWALDEGIATNEQLAIAKSQASRTARWVPMQAHVIHGGLGIVTEYDLQFFSRRGKQASVSWGSEAECIEELAVTIEAPEKWI